MQVQLASLPPPIAEPGPAAPPSAAAVARENPPELPLALPNGKVFEGEELCVQIQIRNGFKMYVMHRNMV